LPSPKRATHAYVAARTRSRGSVVIASIS
jgi:hypothetical protein